MKVTGDRRVERAVFLLNSGNILKAERELHAALRKKPYHVRALTLVAILSALGGRPEEALAYFARAHTLAPEDPFVTFNYGKCLTDEGRFVEGIQLLLSTTKTDPGRLDGWLCLADAQFNLKLHDDAAESCRKALALDPFNVGALNNLGSCELKRDNYTEALSSFEAALSLQPNNLDTHRNRVVALIECGRLSEAKRGLESHPLKDDQSPKTTLVKGDLFYQLCEPGPALEEYRKVLISIPGDAVACMKTAAALRALGNHQDAITVLEGAPVGTHPNQLELQFQLGLDYLCDRQLSKGWPLYHLRWKQAAAKLRPPASLINKPVWTGMQSTSLLVWAEQGIGDQIFYLRFLPSVLEIVSKVILCIDKRLWPLLGELTARVQLVTASELSNLEQEHHVAIGDLPAVLGVTSCDSYVFNPGYLTAPIHLKGNPGPFDAQFAATRCGLSWRSENPTWGADKSVPLVALKPLISMTGWNFINLQYGDTGQEEQDLTRMGLRLTRPVGLNARDDLVGLALEIEQCDLIVTISNVTAHLAGALGKEVLLLLPKAKGLIWYWHFNGTRSDWYPTIQIFRQTDIGDWQGPIEEIVSAIKNRPRRGG